MRAYTLGEWGVSGEDPGLIQDIAKAINGQYSAIACYEKLARLAPTEEERRQIMEIRQDETNHYREFYQIYVRLTGQQPQIAVEPCPDDYKEGLEFALKDEQNTVDFYLEIADKARDPAIKKAFTRAAQDEQNHAVWFLYFWTNHCRCRCKQP
ncbi:ferritin-like domain-containing protein [Polycladomyces subterraneus]|uniref:Ferritin-like domain-containing protein n=1 Tax=Polycladomyces subterraneus TaxID=1016997 RepID=A0ABT8IKB5_9BACL|nr:ferritin-like domain-containing protein [Polycladomyces subterraneus]MDN4593229.1 ferritin-like domain-containing protein [Polycladomyces subterraneus]